MYFVSILAFSFALGLVDPNPNRRSCCPKKTVGNVAYTLIRHEDTRSFDCLNDCVYEKDDEEGSRICFSSGNQIPTCQASPVNCLPYPEEHYQELIKGNSTLTFACCSDGDGQIKTCSGNECSTATSCGRRDRCVITDLDINATQEDIKEMCKSAHTESLLVFSNCVACNSCVENCKDCCKTCFGPDATVLLKSGKEKLMKDLKIGEEVMSDDEGGVTEFIGWLQKESKVEAEYLRISTSGGDQLTLTGSHNVFFFHGNTRTSTFARNLVSGDVLVGKDGQGKIIRNIESVNMVGSLSPLTRSGTIMANNIYSSCYASFPHELANLAMLPARMFPRLFLDNEETLQQDGTRPYVATMKWIGRALGFGQKVEKNEKDGRVMNTGEVLFAEESIVPYGQFCQLIHK